MWAGVFSGENTRSVEEVTLGSMSNKCPTVGCESLFYEAERISERNTVPFWCCNKSTRALLTEQGVFKDIIDPNVHELYFGSSEVAQHFQRHIRAYNHVLCTAMPSTRYGGIYRRSTTIVTVNGKITFKAPSYPHFSADGMPDMAGQLFFVDASPAVTARRLALSTDPGLRRDVVELLEGYLRANNDFVRTFQLAGEVERTLQRSDQGGSECRRVMLVVNPHREGFRTTDRYCFVSLCCTTLRATSLTAIIELCTFLFSENCLV